MKKFALIVEDEAAISNFIKVSLETQDYECMVAGTGVDALAVCEAHRPDVVLLDLGLPDMDGLRVLANIREASGVPVIIVSARGHEREKVEALDAGADDYLTKPFGIAELLARVRVAARRDRPEKTTENASFFRLGDLSIDFEKMRVRIEDADIHLTPIEYDILTLLARHQGKVLTHKFIVNEVWGNSAIGDTQKLRVTMGNLRRKIEADTAQPRYIRTEVGVGYRMPEE